MGHNCILGFLVLESAEILAQDPSQSAGCCVGIFSKGLEVYLLQFRSSAVPES